MDDHVYDTNFTEEISNKMQVPKSIRVNGDVSDYRPTSFYADDNSRFGDNFDMRVPEKIVLMGKNNDIAFITFFSNYFFTKFVML
jgi:hypothetical protein